MLNNKDFEIIGLVIRKPFFINVKILLSVLLFFRKQSLLSLHMSLEIFIAAVGHNLLIGLNSGNVYSVSLR